MSLDRVIGFLTGAERLAATLEIARNIGDPGPAPAPGRMVGTPGTIRPPADVVPAGLADADAITQAGPEAEYYALTLPPASRSLLGLRPPLADARAANSSSTARGGQSSASGASAGTGSGGSTTSAASSGSTAAVAGLPEAATLAANAPVTGTYGTDATDLPLSQPMAEFLADSGEAGTTTQTSTAASAGMPEAMADALLGAALAAETADGTTTPAALAFDTAPDSTADAAMGSASTSQSGDTPDAAGLPAGTTASATAAADTPDSAAATAASSTYTAAAATSGAERTNAATELPLRDPLLLAGVLTGGTAGTAQAERAGIIASFVLNAAMIPGWPPPRPLESARPDAAIAVRQLQAGMDDAEAAGYLAKLGVPASLLARLAAWLEAFKRRARILFGLMVLIGSSLAVLRSLKDEEDEPDEDELMAPDGRARLFLR